MYTFHKEALKACYLWGGYKNTVNYLETSSILLPMVRQLEAELTASLKPLTWNPYFSIGEKNKRSTCSNGFFIWYCVNWLHKPFKSRNGLVPHIMIKPSSWNCIYFTYRYISLFPLILCVCLYVCCYSKTFNQALLKW